MTTENLDKPKQLEQTEYPFYYAGLFLLALPTAIWERLDVDTDERLSASCTLFHEYIHYIQDTTTYYGLLYRIGKLNNDITGVMAPNVVGANVVDTEGLQGVAAVVNGELTFQGHSVGSVLIKENMAVAAQEYAFEGVGGCNIPSSGSYTAVTMYVWREIPELKHRYLLTFSLFEITLQTENPASALRSLIKFLKTTNLSRKARYYAEEELVGMFYDECEGYLERSGLMDYQKMRTANIMDKAIDVLIEGSMATLPYEDGQVEQYPETSKLFSYFEQKARTNLAYRINRPTVVARTLMDFKRSLDMNMLYQIFGRPYMLSVDDKGMVRTNIADIIR